MIEWLKNALALRRELSLGWPMAMFYAWQMRKLKRQMGADSIWIDGP